MNQLVSIQCFLVCQAMCSNVQDSQTEHHSAHHRKARRSAQTVTLLSICASMIIYNFLFLFGLENKHNNSTRASVENIILPSDDHQDPDKGPCTAFTALMQYFLLATFTWNTLYAADLLVMFRKRHTARYVSIIYTVIGWGK